MSRATQIMRLFLGFLLMLFGLCLRRFTRLFVLLYRFGLLLNSVRFAHRIRFLTWLALLSQFLIWLVFTLILLRLPSPLCLLLLQPSRPLHFSPLLLEHLIDAFLQKLLFLPNQLLLSLLNFFPLSPNLLHGVLDLLLLLSHRR